MSSSTPLIGPRPTRPRKGSAAAAALSADSQLLAYPGTTAPVIQRLMSSVGTTRMITDVQRHLHTNVPDSARYCLGNVGGPGLGQGRFRAALG